MIDFSYEKNGCREITLQIKNTCGESAHKAAVLEGCSDSLWVLQSNISLTKISMSNESVGWGINDDTIMSTSDGGHTWTPLDFQFQNTNVRYGLSLIHI